MAAVRQEIGLRVAVEAEELASVCNKRPRKTVAASGMLPHHREQLHIPTDHAHSQPSSLHCVEIHNLHETA